MEYLDLTTCSVQALLEELSSWGPVTTIVFSHGSVFEFKGSFPLGKEGEGFYNFGHEVSAESGGSGFKGHLRLDNVANIRFQDRAHRGRSSYAFVFEDDDSNCIFKVFLGRDLGGEIDRLQLEKFNMLRSKRDVTILD